MGRRPIDETGNRYGRLVVSHQAPVPSRDAIWLCLCDCGNEIQVAGAHLRAERGTRSCGCLKREQASALIRSVAKAQVGPLHPAWAGEDVSYGALHVWLNKHKMKTGICSRCHAERYTEWANIAPDRPHSRDLDDYQEFCKPCHMRLDGHPWVGRAKKKERA